jgi:predicted ATPase/DNA-binding CsgD family transcriptional regulator
MVDHLPRRVPGLPTGTTVQPWRSLGTVPNNLPRQSTRFVGREQQLQALRAWVLREDVHLLTLTGPGGTGKTRLALQAAADVLEVFPDGVFFIPLARIADPELVPSAIAQALDVKESAGRPLLASLVGVLRDRSLLLLVDNFEHVAAAATTLAELVAACPRLKVMVTSRSVLNLYGEHEVPVPPLALPDRRAAPTARHAIRFESVRLFVERAQATRPDFSLTDANAAQVIDVCQRLDGLPLALELAASRLRGLPLPALLERLERRLPLLTGGPRDAPARQRTLRDAIAWSYDLLDAHHQILFRRLAVFRGCTLNAVQTVCCSASIGPGSTSVAVPPLDLDPLDGAEALVGASLLRQEATTEGQPWYVMLETIREYALERLAESGEADAVRRRHVAHYLSLAEAAEPQLTGADQPALFACLEREHDNACAAIRWCGERGYAEPAFRLGLALWWFWAVHGHLSEGRQLLVGLLDRFRPRDASARHGALRGRVLQAAGYLAEFQNDTRSSRAHHEEALRVFRGLDDGPGIESAVHALGQIATLEGEFQQARELGEEALRLAREQNNPFCISGALSSLAHLAHRRGDVAAARSLVEEAIEVKRRVATPHDIAFHAINLSALLEEQGEYAAARELHEQSLAGCREAGDLRTTGFVLAKLAGVMILQGEHEAAHRALREGLLILEEIGDPGGVAQVLEAFATLATAQSRPVHALRLAGAASALRESVDAPLPDAAVMDLDRKLAPARRALRKQGADAAWTAGRLLAPATAIAEALTDDRPASLPEPLPEPLPAPGSDLQLDGRQVSAERPRSGARQQGPLTAREREVARLIGHGLTNRQIAAELVITEGTVANHVVNILNRLGVSSRAQIAVWASEHGLLVGRA